MGVLSFLKKLMFTDDYQIERYGKKGERKAGSVLERRLPKDYRIIRKMKVTYKGETSEIDSVVVGKTGVYIVEVKRMKGRIIGKYEWKDWIQEKTDRYGEEHSKTFYSPVKQVGTHTYRLANFLRDNKIFVHINSAVYFVEPDMKLSLNGEVKDIPVFTYRSTQGLIDYIMSGNSNLSEKTVSDITELLRKCIYK